MFNLPKLSNYDEACSLGSPLVLVKVAPSRRSGGPNTLSVLDRQFEIGRESKGIIRVTAIAMAVMEIAYLVGLLVQ